MFFNPKILNIHQKTTESKQYEPYLQTNSKITFKKLKIMKNRNNTTGKFYRNVVKIILFGIIFIMGSFFGASVLQAQTVLINPAGNGGFELGSTFAANGWTDVQSASGNKWYVGTYTKTAGSRGVYVGTSASNNNYTKWGFSSAARVQHFYRDVTFPAGETDITLSFKWRCEGEVGHDDIKVFLAPTGVTPTAGTEISAAYLVGGAYDSENTYQIVTIQLSAANAGTTKRLIFQWRNDNNFLGTNPAGAFDEISLTTCAPLPAPTTTSGSICDLGTVPISATPGTGGNSINWWDAPTGGNLLLADAVSAVVNINATGSYTFYASTLNNVTGCGSTVRTAVTASSYPRINVEPTASVTSGCAPYSTNVAGGVSRSAKSTVSLSVPDNNVTGVTSSVGVSGFSSSLNNTTVRIHEVKFNINHTWDGDLIIKLIAPDASELVLVNRRGGSGNNFTNTIIKTGGTPIASGSAPFTGTFAPENPFSNFNGKNPNGTWGLNVSDRAGGDIGTLLNWEISFVDDNGLTYSWTSTPAGFTSSASQFIESISSAITFHLDVSNSSQGCSNTGNLVMDVLPTPAPTATTNAPICTGEQLTVGVDAYSSYQWSGPNGFNSTLQNPVVSGNAQSAHAGTYTVTVTNTFLCTASTFVNVTVDARPVPYIINQTNVSCFGAGDGEVEVGSSGVGPFTFDWGFGSDYANTTTISNLSAGSFNVSVWADNGCQSDPDLGVTITEPTQLVVSPSMNGGTCVGETIYLYSNASGGTPGYSYSWSGPNGFSNNSENPSISNISLAESGTYTITVTDNNGCSESSIINITVNALPVVTITPSGSTTFCDGGSVNLDASAGASWLWSTGSTNQMITVTTTGNYAVTVTDGNGCSSTASEIVTVNSLPVASISGSSTGCGEVILTASGGNSYQWNGGVTPGAATNTFNSSGSYSVIVTDLNGCSASATELVTVKALPTAILTGTGNLCLGNSGTVALNFTGTGPWSYTISGDGGPFNGTAINATENVSVTPVTSGIKTYSISALSDANCVGSGSGSAVFKVSTFGPQNTVKEPTAPVSSCSGNISLITSNVVNGENIEYSWNTGSNSSEVLFSDNVNGPFVAGPFKTTTAQVYAQFNTLSQWSSGYNICVQGENGCGVTNNRCTFVRGLVSVPAGIIGSVVQCSQASNQEYSVATPLPDGVETFVWSFSVPGAIITSLDPPLNSQVTIDFPTFTAGTLSVKSALSCLGSSMSAARTMTISNAPIPPAVPSGPGKICPGQTYTYSVPLVNGASTYNWTVPANATINSGAGTNSITVEFNATPVNFSNASVSVSTAGICLVNSSQSQKTISSLVPSTPGAISGITTSACDGPYTYSVSPVSGVIYNWTWPAGVTNNTLDGFNSINLQFPNNFVNGQISVTAQASGCLVESNPRTLNVKGSPATPGIISSIFPPCNLDPGQFETTPVTGATSYQWTVPANGTTLDNGQGTTTIDVTWGVGSGVLIVKALNSCGQSGSRTLTYTPGCRLSNQESEQAGISSLTVYPNPASTNATMAFNAAENGDYAMSLQDVSGRIVLMTVITAQAGTNVVEMDLSNYAKGMYLIMLKSKDSIEKSRLVIE